MIQQYTSKWARNMDLYKDRINAKMTYKALGVKYKLSATTVMFIIKVMQRQISENRDNVFLTFLRNTGVSVRLLNILNHENIDTFDRFMKLTNKDINKFPNCGIKTKLEIKSYQNILNFKFKRIKV